MIKHIKFNKSAMLVLMSMALFSCQGNYQEIQKMGRSDNAPIAIGQQVDVKYTDSGRVVTNLKAPLLHDYSNLGFPYQEFPEGVEVWFWNEQDEVSKVEADYAIRYEETSLVDLRKNVKLLTSDSLELMADQIFWDQKNKWVFTDQPYRIRFKDGSYNDGQGFDSNEDFTTFLSRANEGIQLIDNDKENNGS
jgi:LPS export ABC transporter protein LptC